MRIFNKETKSVTVAFVLHILTRSIFYFQQRAIWHGSTKRVVRPPKRLSKEAFSFRSYSNIERMVAKKAPDVKSSS